MTCTCQVIVDLYMSCYSSPVNVRAASLSEPIHTWCSSGLPFVILMVLISGHVRVIDWLSVDSAFPIKVLTLIA